MAARVQVPIHNSHEQSQLLNPVSLQTTTEQAPNAATNDAQQYDCGNFDAVKNSFAIAAFCDAASIISFALLKLANSGNFV